MPLVCFADGGSGHSEHTSLSNNIQHGQPPKGTPERKLGMLRRVFSRQNTYLAALKDARPGDGIGYPHTYDGQRPYVDYEFLKTCKALRRSSGAYRFNDRIVIKVGDTSRMSEAAAMRLLSQKTTIPIPTVHDAYIQEDGCGVIIMEFVEGLTLDKAWPTYDHVHKQSVVHQLKRYMDELGQIQSTVISSVDGGPCCDQFFSWDMREYGPYSTEMQFHEGLVQALQERADHSWSRMVARFLRSMSGHETVLTHNDLNPSNILVHDGAVVAILDWERAGFYPNYWEYVKAYLFADWQSVWVADSIPDKILQPKRTELAFMLHARDIMWP